MKKFNLSKKTALMFCAGLFLYGLVFINEAAAPPPPPPPPPSVPAGGDIAFVITAGLITAVGVWKFRGRKK